MRIRISGNASSQRVSTSVLKMLQDPPMSTSGLFQIRKLSNELTPQERRYYNCVELIKGYAKSGEFTGDVSIDEVCAFFAMQFRLYYGHGCIDYNMFNCRATFKNLKEMFGFTNNELLLFVAESFQKYSSIKKQLNLKETELSVSTFKRNFILEALNGSGTRFDGFY